MPTSARIVRPTLPVWAIVSAAWIGPAILAVFDSLMRSRLTNRPLPGWPVLAWSAGDWLICGALTPVVFALARRFPIRRGLALRNVALHVLASLAFCVAWAGAGVLLRALLLAGPDSAITAADTAGWLLTTLPFGVPVYFAVLGVEHASFYLLEVRQRDAQAAQLAAQLAEAQLGALQMQLQPHFLFNSLNAVGVLVREHDTAGASRMLELLADLLREVLTVGKQSERSLAREVAFVERYLAIERVRFSDRLRPTIDIGPGLADAAVPTFILQPLVENALRHGIAKRTGAGLVQIAVRRDQGDLVVSVRDDGPGPGSATTAHGGLGLDNTRARLATLYGDRATAVLAPDPAGGTVATVRFPYRELTDPGEGKRP